MIVGVCGFGNTGASAALVYLKQFPAFHSIFNGEFQLLHEADGINDLKYYLTGKCDRITVNAAIHRFIFQMKNGLMGQQLRKSIGIGYDEWIRQYLEELIQVSWSGDYAEFDPNDISPMSSHKFVYTIQEKVHYKLLGINKNWHYPKYRERYFSIMSEDEFDRITKKYLGILFEELGATINQNLVIDMLFSATNPVQGMEFFDDPKAIIVNRDPRDIYLAAKINPVDSRFMPNDNVHNFIRYYSAIQKQLNRIQNDNRVLIVQFEDMIYDYECCTKKIIQFIGETKVPAGEFVIYDPVVSMRYTNMQKQYTEYKNDIAIIEKELSEYLYDFDKKKSPEDDKDIMKKRACVNYQGIHRKDK